MKSISPAGRTPCFNVFAHSDFGLDTLQARVFTLLLDRMPASGPTLPVRVRTGEILGDNPGHRHQALLEEALSGLSGKRLRRPGQNRRSMGFYPVFEYICRSDGEGGTVEALFSGRVAQDLRELTGSFSLREIASLLMLRHSHTQRLFWLLRAYADGWSCYL